MRFSIAVNMTRRHPDVPMERVAAEALEMVVAAERLGFDVAWAAEHHTVEYTIAPNPLVLIMHWAAHARTIRLGTAVITAPYWNPLRAAGEIALAGILTNGRLEVGFGRGAYQYEFDRMAGGLAQERGGDHLRELIPACRDWGCRQLIAVIGDSENTASIRVHEKLGFQHSGVLRNVGFKFDRWIDTVMMQLPL